MNKRMGLVKTKMSVPWNFSHVETEPSVSIHQEVTNVNVREATREKTVPIQTNAITILIPVKLLKNVSILSEVSSVIAKVVMLNKKMALV